MIFEFYEQKYVEKVYLKFNLAQSTKQERPYNCYIWTYILNFIYLIVDFYFKGSIWVIIMAPNKISLWNWYGYFNNMWDQNTSVKVQLYTIIYKSCRYLCELLCLVSTIKLSQLMKGGGRL